MYGRWLGKRNPEKDEERLLVQLATTALPGTSMGYMIIPCLGGNEGGDITSRRTWMDDDINRGVNINSSGDQVSGIGLIPNGVSSITIYPLLNCSSSGSIDIYFSVVIDTYLSTDSDSSYIDNTFDYTGGINWGTDQDVSYSITMDVGPGSLVQPYIQAGGVPSAGEVFVLGWVLVLS